MAFQFELNLQQMALLRKAISIWEQPDIKEMTWKIYAEDSKITWPDVMKESLEQVKSTLLPVSLKNELLCAVRNIGLKIKDWYEYIRSMPYLVQLRNLSYIRNDHYVKNICWTRYGVIDEAKTVKTYVDKVKTMKSFPLNKEESTEVYFMACFNALEEEIYYLLKDKVTKPKVNQLHDKCLNVIVTYWLYYRWGNNSSKRKFFQIIDAFSRGYSYRYNRSLSVEKKMLLISAMLGYSNAVTYFWEKACDGEDDYEYAYWVIKEYILLVKEYHYYLNITCFDRRCYKDEQYAMLSIFFINKVTETNVTLYEFYTRLCNDCDWRVISNGISAFQIFKILLIDERPLDSLPIINEILFTEIDDNACMKSYSWLLLQISRLMESEFIDGLVIENSSKQRMLQKVWTNIPSRVKLLMVEMIARRMGFIKILFDIFDITSIQLIIETPEMSQKRSEILKIGKYEPEKLIESKRYKLLDPFIETVLVTDEEKKEFKRGLCTTLENYLKDSLKRNRFKETLNRLDEFLDWQDYSLEERKNFIKDKIPNSLEIFNKLSVKSNSFDEVDMFFRWLHLSEDEVKEYKNQPNPSTL